MSTVRRRSRARKPDLPSVMALYWAGSLPPETPGSAEDRELVIEAKFFSWCDKDRPIVSWTHHPFSVEWSRWMKTCAD